MASRKDQELHRASARGDIDLVRRLLEQGANPNALVKGGTAVHAAASTGKSKVIPVLLAGNANINAIDQDGCTPLMVACSVGKATGSEAAMTLIDLGADATYVRTGDDETALRLAIPRALPSLLRELVKNGASVDGPHDTAITPLMRAAVEDKVDAANVLISLGADIDRKCKLPWAKGKTAEEIAIENKRLAVAEVLRSARVSRREA